MKCRVCDSNNVKVVGNYKPYLDYECMVYDCNSCGCRFTKHDDSIYEKLHASNTSSYSFHNDMAMVIHNFFSKKDLKSLRKYLSKIQKNSFVINRIEYDKNLRTLLEIGCSKGYLTSYFIAKGYKVIGVDTSHSAIREAKKLFGDDYFASSDPTEIWNKKKFDAIYHVGTIGCVKSPLDMTKYLLSRLKKGGILVFNAPNVNALYDNKFWVDGTSPPDLVTLFSEDFWRNYFNDIAHVEITYEPMDGYMRFKNFFIHLLRLDKTQQLAKLFVQPSQQIIYRMDGALPYLLKTIIRKMIRILGNINIFPKYIPEFGMYIVMIKK